MLRSNNVKGQYTGTVSERKAIAKIILPVCFQYSIQFQRVSIVDSLPGSDCRHSYLTFQRVFPSIS